MDNNQARLLLRTAAATLVGEYTEGTNTHKEMLFLQTGVDLLDAASHPKIHSLIVDTIVNVLKNPPPRRQFYWFADTFRREYKMWGDIRGMDGLQRIMEVALDDQSNFTDKARPNIFQEFVLMVQRMYEKF